MNKLDSAIVENKESTCQVSHPTIGKIYCLNASEARATLHEISSHNTLRPSSADRCVTRYLLQPHSRRRS